jgi:ppGpp synthetase/RelA/SpoT-type nucleotidyltranferase
MLTVDDLDHLRERLNDLKPQLEQVTAYVIDTLEAKIRRRGVHAATVDGRVKDTASFVKKVIRKSYGDPWNEIHDKVGVRVTVVFAGDIDAVSAVVNNSFTVTHSENKLQAFDPTTFDYLGLHYEVTIPEDVLPESPVRDCEIQIRTSVQSAWADISHELFYKAPIEVSQVSRRSLHRLMALVELFDLEVGRIREAIMGEPDFWTGQLLERLERGFLTLTGHRFDPELSRFVVDSLSPALPAEPRLDYLSALDSFVDQHRTKLESIYKDYLTDDRHPLLSQPESLLIFERLEANRFILRGHWPEALPFAFLEGLANVWGLPIDADDDL